MACIRKSSRPFYILLAMMFLVGCQARIVEPGPRGDLTLPPAQPGNIALVINDEAPVITNQSGVPIRRDEASDSAVVHYEGLNEE